MNNEKYFVTSNGDEPEQIFFSKQEAFDTESNYVDSFDENGIKVNSYKWVDNGYTQDF